MYKAIILFILLIGNTLLFSQKDQLSTKSSKAKKNYETAIGYLDKENFIVALQYLEQAIGYDSNFIEAWIVRGDCYMFMKNCSNAIESYYKAININPNFYPNIYYLVAEQELKCEKYEDAVKNYEKYLSKNESYSNKNMKIREDYERAKFCLKLYQNPIKFNPINMGPNINSSNDEYLPTLTADEQTLIITVRRPRDINTVSQTATEEDFYISIKDKEGIWTEKKAFKEINTHYNEGAQCISPDGKYLIYTMCNSLNGFGSCDLYWSKKIGDNWTTPRNCGRPLNTESWESQPTFAADGKTIYFVSNRYGGVGGSDVWQTTMIDDGVFSRPKNLGKTINTQGDDVSPFIHPDGITLYFASNGHKGMGGKDLFMSKLKDDSTWSEPKNLGYPINSPEDEINLVVNTIGDKAYFSTAKIGGYGGLDLYHFELDETIRPNPVTYFKGKVFDEKTKIPLQANVELINLTTGNTYLIIKSDKKNGEFLICIPTNNDYALNVNHDDYLFYSDNFKLSGVYSKTEPFEKDIPLKSLNIGQTVVLNNIFFETDSFKLKDISKIELERVITFLNKNKRIKIEIGGHTDNQGNKDYNMKLSNNRAKAVLEYLLSKGIAKDRVESKGYGMNNPIATNDSDVGRAKNRRTEFKIIGF